MRVAGLLLVVLAACSFDGSGTRGVGDDDDGATIDGAVIADSDARPVDAMPPPPPDAAPPDAWIELGCDFDFQCDVGEADWCPDCDNGGGGGFVCDFDSMCEPGESDECLDCLGQP